MSDGPEIERIIPNTLCRACYSDMLFGEPGSALPHEDCAAFEAEFDMNWSVYED